jgi:hypothetical protein
MNPASREIELWNIISTIPSLHGATQLEINRWDKASQPIRDRIEQLSTQHNSNQPFLLLQRIEKAVADGRMAILQQYELQVRGRANQQQLPHINKLRSLYDSQCDFSPANDEKKLHRKVPSGGFTVDSVELLNHWFESNIDDPYPSSDVKQDLADTCGLSYDQVQHWFINARMRRWRPLLRQQAKAQDQGKHFDILGALRGKEYIKRNRSEEQSQEEAEEASEEDNNAANVFVNSTLPRGRLSAYLTPQRIQQPD